MRGRCVLKDPRTIHAVLSTISSSEASYRVLSHLRVLSLCLQRGASFFWGFWSSQSHMMAIALHLNCTSVPSSGNFATYSRVLLSQAVFRPWPLVPCIRLQMSALPAFAAVRSLFLLSNPILGSLKKGLRIPLFFKPNKHDKFCSRRPTFESRVRFQVILQG
jgi:hypothetical protein